MATQEKTWNVANRLHSLKDSDNPEMNHIIAGADEIYDDAKGAKQSDINAQTETALADRYTKAETYSKEQLDSLITTPDANYMSVVATNATTAVTDILPATGEANTIYRIGNWNGTQYDPTMYTLFAWNGTTYVCLAVRSSVGEVYDVSISHPDGQGNPTPYADLTAALGSDGANIPADIRRGGMRIQFIQGTVLSSDNKYVQYRYMGTATTGTPNPFLDEANWQGVDIELLEGSKNMAESGAVFKVTNGIKYIGNFSYVAGTTISPDNCSVNCNIKSGDTFYVEIIGNNYEVITLPYADLGLGCNNHSRNFTQYTDAEDEYIKFREIKQYTATSDISNINLTLSGSIIVGTLNIQINIVKNEGLDGKIERLNGTTNKRVDNIYEIINGLSFSKNFTFTAGKVINASNSSVHCELKMGDAFSVEIDCSNGIDSFEYLQLGCNYSNANIMDYTNATTKYIHPNEKKYYIVTNPNTIGSINFYLGGAYVLSDTDVTINIIKYEGILHVINNIKGILLREELLNNYCYNETSQSTVKTGDVVNTVVHYCGNKVVRTDSFLYNNDIVTETRTLSSSDSLTIITNTDTLETELNWNIIN